MGKSKKPKSKAPVAASADDDDNNSDHQSGEEVAADTAEQQAEQQAEPVEAVKEPKLTNKERKALLAEQKKQKGSAKQQRADRREAKRSAVPERAAKSTSSSSASSDAGSDGDASDSDGDDDGEEVVVTRQGPVEVLYCPVCTFPAEMCEFSGMMEKCRPWLQEHAAELADAEERGRKRRALTEKEKLEALVEGRGIKKAIERSVVMEVVERTKRRKSTIVTGMDLFSFNLKDLAKDWRKAFACGVGVHAAEEGKHQDSIDIQGDFVQRLADMLVDQYGIPRKSIFIIKGKKKVAFFTD